MYAQVTATHDIAALCAAIDAGDDLALFALADALEEAGDPRAEGMRSNAIMARCGAHNGPAPGDNAWIAHPAEGVYNWSPMAHHVAWLTWLKLPGRPAIAFSGQRASYPTRSAAYIALAEALGDA